MNAATPPLPPKRRLPVWRWILTVFVAMVILAAIGVWNVVTLTRDAVRLREPVLAALSQRTSTQVQVSVGPALIALVRAGISFVPDLPPEVRPALRGLRDASVGVYRLERRLDADEARRVLVNVEREMAKRGWTRFVAVNDRDATVAAFVPESAPWGSVQKLCLAVCSEEVVVVVAGAIDAEPLAEIAERHMALAKL